MLIDRYIYKKTIVRFKYCYPLNWRALLSRNMGANVLQKDCPLVAITQMRSTNDKQFNMEQVQQLVQMAKKQSAEFVFLPECCDFIGENRNQTLELAEPLTGCTMQQYQALAKEYKVWLSLGGIHESILNEKNEKTNKIFNAHVILNNDGDVVGVYRKLHLFDVETPQFTFRESSVVAPGQSLIAPLTTPIGQMGLQICYDMRFPEASLLLRKAGAQILTYPSAFTYTTGKAHWETLLRSRAIENQCYVIAAAQVGCHNSKRQSWGHAMAINSWGKIIADLGENELDVAIVEIDVNTIEPIRANMPCFLHRRDDIYSLTAYGFGTTEPQGDLMFAENVINKETIFFETPYSFAFTNLCCVVEGHVLVSTKRAISRLKDLNSAEISDLFNTVCYVQRMLEIMYKTTSATVNVQDGTDAGQTVGHVHFHVMPRRPGDFKNNDQIYANLESQVRYKEKRSIELRIEEAQRYREVLQTIKGYN